MRTATLLLLGLAVGTACSDTGKSSVYTSTGPQPYPQRVSSLAVTPSKLSIVLGGQSRFNATPKDALGNPVSGVPISWKSSDTLVASVTDAGVIQALRLGTASVTATADQVAVSATVTVSNVSVASVAVSLNPTTIQVGASAQASAVVRDSNGAVLTDRPVTWASSAPSIASVSADGLVTALSAGSATITGTSESASGQATLTVNPAAAAPVASVTVSLASSNLVTGQTTQASAVLKDASGNVLTGRTISWSSSNTSVATVSNTGVVTAVSVGSSNIVATSEGITGQASVGVTLTPPPAVSSVSVSLGASSVNVGQTTQATVALKDASGTVLTGRSVTWTSSNTSVATVSTAGLVTAMSAGNANIVATSEGVSGQAALNVTLAPVATVSVSLGASTIAAGQTAQATAVLKDAGGTVLTGRTVTWTSSNTAVATVSAAGLVTAVAAGSTNIVATSEGVSGQSALSVTLVPVASVTVTLGSGSIPIGQTTQATAVVKDANGNVLTGRALAWASSNTSVATVSGSGLVSGVGAGSAVITATSEGQSGTATLSVTLAPVATVSVSLGTSSVTVGQTAQGTAVLKDASGNVLTGRAVTWSSSNSSVATVNASTGLVTAVAAGSTNIVATSEGISGQATLSVTPVPVASVTVTLNSSSLTTGQTTQATAILKDASGNVLTGRTVTWASSNTAVATVSSSGLVTALSAGSANIIATSGGVSGQAALSVTLAPVATVTVSLGTSTIAAGQTTQATAILKDASGNVLTGRTVSWASDNTAVATVSGSGLVTGVAAGSAAITATSGGISGSASLTVTAPPPPGVWPNEPAGFQTWTDVDWSTLIPSHWSYPFGTTNAAIVNNATAPFSAPSTLQFTYPIGFTGGSAAATALFSNGDRPTEMYIGFWLKVSNPWQSHSSGINKILFITEGGTTDALILEFDHTAPPYVLRYAIFSMGVSQNPAYNGWLDGNVNPATWTIGVWHRIEIYAKYSTTSSSLDGIVKTWLDGTLIMNYTDINYGHGYFDGFKYSPTWGGIGDTKTETDYYWFDHTHASHP